MSDDERDIRTLLEAEAEHAPRPRGLQQATVRRGMRGRLGAVALPLLVLASVAWVAVAGPFTSDEAPKVVGPAPEADDGLIAFARFNGDGGIYRMAPDGSGVTKIVDDSRNEVDDPAWSPDGTKIAFHGYFDGSQARTEGAIYISDADGTGRRPVQIAANGPTWGPNSDELIFTDEGTAYRTAIPPQHRAPEAVPIQHLEVDQIDWSPTGDNLAFTLGGLYVVPVEGGDPTKVAGGDAPYPADPQWSPDGTQIAFTAPIGDRGYATVEVVDADGSNHRTITNGSSPTWSPDGTRLAFERTDGANTHIYSINVDGTDERQLTFGEVLDHSPDWSPASVEGPECRAVGKGGYRFTVSPSAAAPGDTATISGAIPMYGEGGQYISPASDQALHFWVDVDPEDWQDLIDSKGSPNAYFRPNLHPQQGTYLGSVDLSDPALCDYRFDFQVPDVGEGEHTIVGMLFGGDGAVPMTEGDTLEVADSTNASLEAGPGRVSCHDPKGDLLGEGSGDQSGPGPQPPEEDHPGTDLTGFSMSRSADGTFEMNFQTLGPIPQSLPAGAQLHFLVAARRNPASNHVAAVRASLQDARWTVWARDDDDESEIPVEVEIAGNVRNLVLDPQFVPVLMRSDFNWNARSEWMPKPTQKASEIYTDYCPDEEDGSPRFEGHTT